MLKHLLAPITTALFLIAACNQPETGPWADFVKCAGNNCVKEAIAVKDAYLKDPKGLLAQFQATYEKGEDHVVGWLYIMRDSVLFNSNMGTPTERNAVNQALIEAAKPFLDDPKLGESAKTITSTLEGLSILAEEEDDPELGEPINGTYSYDLGEQGGGELWVRRLSLDQFQFKLSVSGPPPSHNQGLMSGVVKNFNQAEYSATYAINEYGGECEIQFTWDNTGVSLKTLKGEPATCGFGNRVTADGDYKRQGFVDPFLGAKEAKAVLLLEGEWVSETDPKSGITIANGTYADYYDGKMIGGGYAYSYFGKCPADCGRAGRFPCIKLFGQDEVCYAVVKADGKNLELSQVGGTGNTNKYRKK
jgi:hypothetical protein